MISNELRAALRAKTIPGDIPHAAQIYQKITSRKIHKSQLQKFLNGLYPFHNSRPGSHDPSQMYEAIAAAIAERQAKTLETNQKAAQLRRLIETIHNDTKPQPIAL